MSIKLLGNTALLRPAFAKQSAGGIHYCDGYVVDDRQWVVVAVGDGRRLNDGTRILPDIRPGDSCLFNPGLGVKFTFPDGRIIVDAGLIEMIWQ